MVRKKLKKLKLKILKISNNNFQKLNITVEIKIFKIKQWKILMIKLIAKLILNLINKT